MPGIQHSFLHPPEEPQPRRLPRLLLCLSDTGCKAIPPLPNQWSSLLSLPGIPYIPAPSCPSSLWYFLHEPHSFPWPNHRQQKPAQAYLFRMSLSCPHTHRPAPGEEWDFPLCQGQYPLRCKSHTAADTRFRPQLLYHFQKE